MPRRDPCQALRELLATMHTLRSPGGCPWDAAQTPESLAPYILEEACEAIEAIESGTPVQIADELGDLLLQIIFQADIFAGRGDFDFADVAAGINAKLLRRHPHVFAGTITAKSDDELASQWAEIKRAEQAAQEVPAPPLGCLPRHLPALQRAQKLVNRIRRAGASRPHPLLSQLPGTSIGEDELGQALLSLVQQAEYSGLDAEQVLRRVLHKIQMDTAHQPGDAPSET
jgi:uncharacterized protein YabN with tetrapyrrole methylase and pyrophosphatase domain